MPGEKTIRNTLVYVVFGGRKEFYQQCVFSILSLIRFNNDSDNQRILVYTDDDRLLKSFFKNGEIIVENLSKEKLADWMGKDKNLYRPKICSIIETLEKFSGVCMFIDCDTYFISSPTFALSGVNADKSLMYRSEGNFISPNRSLWQPIKEHLIDKIFPDDSNLRFLSPETLMWNSGVIAISFENTQVVKNFLTELDKYYPIVGNTAPMVEQFLCGYFLSACSQVEPSTDFIFHYYENGRFTRRNMQIRLTKFFNNTGDKSLKWKLKKIKSVVGQGVSENPEGALFWKEFMNKRKTALSMAVARVKKTGNPFSFFERGKSY